MDLVLERGRKSIGRSNLDRESKREHGLVYIYTFVRVCIKRERERMMSCHDGGTVRKVRGEHKGTTQVSA